MRSETVGTVHSVLRHRRDRNINDDSGDDHRSRDHVPKSETAHVVFIHRSHLLPLTHKYIDPRACRTCSKKSGSRPPPRPLRPLRPPLPPPPLRLRPGGDPLRESQTPLRSNDPRLAPLENNRKSCGGAFNSSAPLSRSAPKKCATL